MKLHILFGQRKEDYEGQYGPEVLVCWDEFCIDENAEGFEEECQKRLAEVGEDFVSTRVIEVEIDGDKVRDLLVGVPVIEGEIE